MATSHREPAGPATGPPAQPWFSQNERAALQDFWRIYEAHLDEVEPLEEANEIREVLGAAVSNGDFRAWEGLLARRALDEDELGVEPSGRPSLLRVLGRWLVEAYGQSSGRMIAVLGVVGDFEARCAEVRAWARLAAREAAWRRSEHSLAITLESIGDGVIATDEQGRIERMNPAARQLSGWPLEEALGKRIDEVFRVVDEDTGKVMSIHIDQILREGRIHSLPPHSALIARDGSRRSIADSLAPIRDDDGTTHGMVVVFIDQTREREHEQALRHLADSVEASREEERTRIARELHDELGQQLTAIRMDLSWLERRLHEAAAPVKERIAAMSGLVDSITDMVRRIGTELRPGILDTLGLAEAIEWLAGEFERRSGIRVEVEASSEPGSLGRAESTDIFRIFQEILTNVARHSGAKSVEARLTVEEHRVMLTVRDDGRGIRPEEVGSARSLGLLGMRERAAMHGGTFHIEAEQGGGTVVSVELPRTEATRS